MEKLFALLASCEENPHVTNGFPSQQASDVELSLTHWGRVTHICISKLTIIGSGNGLSPDRRQAIIWNNAGILSIGPVGTNFSEISIEILTFSFKKMRLKVSSAKWRLFGLGLNELMWARINWQTHSSCWWSVMSWRLCGVGDLWCHDAYVALVICDVMTLMWRWWFVMSWCLCDVGDLWCHDAYVALVICDVMMLMWCWWSVMSWRLCGVGDLWCHDAYVTLLLCLHNHNICTQDFLMIQCSQPYVILSALPRHCLYHKRYTTSPVVTTHANIHLLHKPGRPGTIYLCIITVTS